MPTVYVKNELGVRTPIQVSSRKYKDMVQSYYMSHPYVPGVGGGGGEQTKTSGSSGFSGPRKPDEPFDSIGHGPGGDQSGVVGPENSTMSTYDLAKIMISIPMHMNPFSSVWGAFTNQFKGENALNMNSVPQTGWNLFGNALGITTPMDSQMGLPEAFNITHSDTAYGLNTGFDPSSTGNPGLADFGFGGDPGADGGGYGMPGGEGVGGLW